jgi:hypothetical protein
MGNITGTTFNHSTDSMHVGTNQESKVWSPQIITDRWMIKHFKDFRNLEYSLANGLDESVLSL